MRLLIDNTFATSTYTVPIVSGLVKPPGDLAVELMPRLAASDVGAQDAALIPASEILELQASHTILPAFAVVANGVGAVAMRTPVRPDEIESTPVRLLDASGGAELLARATLHPFYGIGTAGWFHDGDAPEAARAEVVIVEGAEALREPEGGFSEDLSRAWFILTAQPVVSHLLVLPRDISSERLQAVSAILGEARKEGLARRRDWRPALAQREGIASARSGEFWSAQRLALNEDDRHALLGLLRQGGRGTSSSSIRNVTFAEGVAAE